MFTAIRSHEICMAHRLVGHTGKCQHIHGHNYIVEIEVQCSSPGLDAMGMVMDFSEIKERVCSWLDQNWDHKMILWEKDPIVEQAGLILNTVAPDSIVTFPSNPTAENMANYLLNTVCPALMDGSTGNVTGIRIYETSKCAVTLRKDF